MSFSFLRQALRRLLLLPGVRQVFQTDDEVAWSAHNRKTLKEKEILRRLYLSYYGRHVAHLAKVPGRTLEVGSGGGFFKEVCPEALTSEVLRVGQVELVLDAERLPFVDGSLANIVFIGVLHHLREPFRFFEEAQRALTPGGRIIFTEPHVSWLSYFVYKYLHHEPCEFSGIVEKGGPLLCGNLAVASVLFGRRRAEFESRFPGLRLRVVTYHDIFLYLLSGGVNYRSFVPGVLFSPLRAVEGVLSPVAKYLSMFMTVVIEKKRTKDEG
ncbi:MAG: class I SAM-dependent methyltransferase [Candidatus Latescibacteria bacterium]|nr:class I SAM-dependent methyltransferase [Candidatus Latescibacterota bacterium]